MNNLISRRCILTTFNILIALSFTGCIGFIGTTATAVGAVSTAKEIDEDYNGDFLEYTEEKATDLYYYLDTKFSN